MLKTPSRDSSLRLAISHCSFLNTSTVLETHRLEFHICLAESLHSDASLARNYSPPRTMKNDHSPTEITGSFAIDVNGVKISPRVFKSETVLDCPREQHLKRARIMATQWKFGLREDCRFMFNHS